MDTLLEFALMLTFCVPGTVIGVAYILTYNIPPVEITGTAMVLLERTTQTLTQPVQLYAVTQRNIDGLGVGLTGEAQQHSWQTAVRRDVNSQFGGQTTGSLGYGYALTPQWRIGASYGTSFVAPSFADLYYPGYSNPNLTPEQGKSAEVSLRWASGGQSLRTAWVDTRIQNAIVLERGRIVYHGASASLLADHAALVERHRGGQRA